MARLKALVQYLVILSITGFLLWLALRKLISSEDGEDVIGLLLSTWSESDIFT